MFGDSMKVIGVLIIVAIQLTVSLAVPAGAIAIIYHLVFK